jgi:hydrogenase nickel incorporation protein HypA/HybF
VHELSLSAAILKTIEKHAEGRRVTVVSLRVGSLRQVVPDTLAFAFEIVARGTVCEGARLDQELVQAVLRCGEGHEWALDEPIFRCPVCGEAGEIVSGNEFMVESIDVTDKEPACTA